MIVNNFSQLVQALEDGRVHLELSDRLPALIEALQVESEEQGTAKGKIVLTIDLTATGREIEAKAKFVVTEPAGARRRSIFWTTSDHKLTQDNPRQADMFRPVSIHTGE